jgi:hypothetical protein
MLTVALLGFAFLPEVSQGAKVDSTAKELPDSVREKLHSPQKATIMSACLPGLGQIYNRKYWKVPIIYAGFGVLGYLIAFNTSYYLDFKCAYVESVNGNTNGNYAYLVNRYTQTELVSSREYYRRNLEISILVTALWYILNILDATVDGHLYSFNISRDLSMKVEPALISGLSPLKPSGGIKLSFRF